MATLMSYFAPPIAGEWGDEAEDNTDGVPVLRTTNFTADGRLSYDDLTYRSIDTEKKENKILQPGDIIIEKSGGTPKKPVGRCVYFDRDDDYDYFCSNFTAILRANTEEVNTKYLWYILQEHYKTRQCLKYQYKTNGIANLDIKDYLSHKEVELPPREVQDKRVEAMDYSQHLLDLHQELLDIMDNAVKSRFIEMFGDPVTNPMGWERIRLADKCEIVTGNTPSRKVKEYYGNDIEWIKSDNITEATNLTTATEYLSDEGAKVGRIVEAGSILMTCIAGSLRSIGNVAIADRAVAFNQQINAILPNEQSTYFMYEQFRLSKEYICSGVNMALKGILSKGQLSEIEFIFPPVELQKQFADFVSITDKSKLTIQKSMDNLQELRNSLLQEYFG